MAHDKNFDVIIIGGSYAGLSAAMALGRSLRQVLVIDSGLPCNRQTPHSHNFLTQDGKTPSEISLIARQELKQYNSLVFYQGLAVSAQKINEGFVVTTQSKERFTTKKIILATGIKDLFPPINGFAECWGISIIHCPYCHGYEYRQKNTAIIGKGERAFHLAAMVSNLTSKVTVLTNGKADFDHEQLEKLNKHNITIIETDIIDLVHTKGVLQQVVFKDNTKMAFDVAYGVVPFAQQSGIAEELGCALDENGYIKINPMQATSIDGVFACGDNSSRMRSLANAVSSGSIAGAVLNGLLVQEQF